MKKQVAGLISSVVLASTVFAGVAAAKSENAQKALTALGDSITFGYNLEQHNHRVSKDAFPFLIGDAAGLRVRDLGVSGWTTVDLLDAMENSEKFRQSVKHADYITLNIGSNDLLRAFADYEVTPAEVQALLVNLSKIIGEVREISQAPIVVYNIYNPFQVEDPRQGIGNYLLTQINGQIGMLVGQLNVGYGNLVLADAFRAFGANQAKYVFVNDIHPTHLGQQVLAEIGLKALGLVKE